MPGIQTHSAPAVVSRGYNNLDVFARGTDNAIYQQNWNGSAWSGWTKISANDVTYTAPGVVATAGDRLDLFIVRPDKSLDHKYWRGSNKPWSGWEQIDGPMTTYSAPAAVKLASNSFMVFVRGIDNNIKQKRWTGSAWTEFAPIANPGDIISAPAVASWGPDRFDLFGQGTDNNIYQKSRTPAPPDTTPPAAPHLSLAFVSTDSVRLQWNIPSDDRGVASFRIYRNGALVAQPTNRYGQTDTWVPAEKEKVNSYTIQAVDYAGNVSAMSNAVDVDLVSPSAPYLQIIGASSTQINLRWRKSTDNIGVTTYRVFRNDVGAIATIDAAPSPTQEYWTYNDTNVKKGNAYIYYIKAYDAQGNEARSNDPAAIAIDDTAAPSAPGGLAGTVLQPTPLNTSARVQLKWFASTDNVFTTGYRIYRDDVLLGTTSELQLSYYDDSAVKGRTYRYKVQAVDYPGNLSAFGSVISVTVSGTTSPTATD